MLQMSFQVDCKWEVLKMGKLHAIWLCFEGKCSIDIHLKFVTIGADDSVAKGLINISARPVKCWRKHNFLGRVTL